MAKLRGEGAERPGRSELRTALRVGAALLLLALGVSSVGVQAETAAAKPVVFAAASLKNALDAVNAQWEKGGKPPATISYAASSALAKQIESGAPADVFVSADLDWMDYLDQRKLIRADTRGNLLGNRLVLVAPRDAKVALKIEPGFKLGDALGKGRLAMADPATIPAGKYGKAALEALGAWSSVQDRVAQAENVRAALQLVARGEAPLGIVYLTDARSEPGVAVVGEFPENSHPPILYPAALTSTSSSPDAAEFLIYLRSPAARPLFEAQGFSVLVR